MKPTPHEVLTTIFEQVKLDEINQELDDMSDEDIAKDLEAAGYTQAQIDKAFEKQQKMLDDLSAEEKRERRRQVASYVGGLATAAAVVLAVRTRSTPETFPTATSAATTQATPETLRKDAFEACGRGHWAECERKLDDAKALDPDGERDPDVRNARKLLQNRPR
jgi:hypothetical protein